MATPSYARSLASAFKRLKIQPSTPRHQSQTRHIRSSAPQKVTAVTPTTTQPLPPSLERELSQLRLPLAVQATYLNPLRREGKYQIPTAALELRSYSVRNLEDFADFAMRAAYFLKLPTHGPKPLRRKVERWTVPRSNFVHKKSQENFERVTMRRRIVVWDGHPETVAVWLAFIKKHRYYGVGMKCNVYEHAGLDTLGELDADAELIPDRAADVFWHVPHYSKNAKVLAQRREKEDDMRRVVFEEPFKGQYGAMAPSGGAQSVPTSRARVLEAVVGRKEPAAPQQKPGREDEQQ